MNFGNFLFGGSENPGSLLGAIFGHFSIPPRPESEPTGYTLALRVMPIYGREEPNTPFIVMMEALEASFRVVHRSSYVAIREIHASLCSDERALFEEALKRHGYHIVDETRI